LKQKNNKEKKMNTLLRSAIFPVMEIPANFTLSKRTNKISGYLPENTGHKFIVREDTGDVLSCMTDEYKLVTNETVLKHANPIIEKSGGKVKEVRMFANGAKTTLKWHFPNGKNEDLTPEIIINNSYNGTSGLNILAGAFRLVCANGMIIGVVSQNYKNKHSVYNIALNDIESVIKETVDKTKLIFTDEFPILQENKISEKHIVKFLKMFPMHANEIVTMALIANKPKTFWDLFNVGTNVLSHNMNRSAESTHNIETSLYNTMKKWALQSKKVARA
jgi:hypothetical protein